MKTGLEVYAATPGSGAEQGPAHPWEDIPEMTFGQNEKNIRPGLQLHYELNS